jgi:CRP/FNR family transcriptional regulator, cyclic AMP receptor protein
MTDHPEPPIEGVGALLEKHPLFEGLNEDMRSSLAECGENIVFHDGDMIIKEGEEANRFFLLRHGTVAVEVHLPGREPLIIETLAKDEVLGWSWMVQPYRWSFDARAIGLVRAVVLDAIWMREKCEQDPQLGFEIYKRFVPLIATRMNATRLQLIDMYGNPRDYD